MGSKDSKKNSLEKRIAIIEEFIDNWNHFGKVSNQYRYAPNTNRYIEASKLYSSMRVQLLQEYPKIKRDLHKFGRPHRIRVPKTTTLLRYEPFLSLFSRAPTLGDLKTSPRRRADYCATDSD